MAVLNYNNSTVGVVVVLVCGSFKNDGVSSYLSQVAYACDRVFS